MTRLPAATSPPEEALKFAGCMRSHGITDFPDPSSGGGFVFHTSAGMTQSPQFQAAQKACQRYMPPGPGSGPAPSAEALAHMVKVSECMRRHGITDFPDPRTSVPPHALAGVDGVISDIDGVVLVFPSTIDSSRRRSGKRQPRAGSRYTTTDGNRGRPPTGVAAQGLQR